MNINTKNFRLLALFVVSLLFASSCSTSNFDSQISDAAISGDPTAMWNDGQKIVNQGEQLSARGEEQLTKGRAQVRQGEENIQNANVELALLREEYQNAAKLTGNAVTPDAVKNEAKILKEIGERWEKSIAKVRDGNKIVDAGNKALSQGQETVQRGRRMLEEGSRLMRNSKRLELGEDLLESPDITL